MRFVILRSNLVAALARCAPIAKQKSTMPVLGCVLLTSELLKPLALATTNLQQSVTTRAPADVAEPGQACVSARDLEARAKTFPEGPITVTLDATHLQLVAGKRKHRIKIVDPAEFPSLPAPSPEGVTLAADAFSAVLEQALPAASEDADRANLHGVFFEFLDGAIRATATDGRRIHYCEQPAPSSTVRPGIILPIPSVEAILAILDGSAMVGMSDRELSVTSGETTVTTKLVDALFPVTRDFLTRMPQESLSVDPKALADSLSSVTQGSGDGALAGILTLTVEDGELVITGKEAQDLLPLPLPQSSHLPPLTLSAPMLLNALRSAPASPLCRLSYGPSPLDPLFLTLPTSTSFQAIVMPCRA